MKKNKVYLLLIFILALCSTTGCRRTLGDPDKIQVVCTTYPIYDWVREIVGEDNPAVQITLLVENGVDMHSYQPGTKDIAVISSCDVFIYVGGESDKWIKDVLDEAVNKNMVTLNLLDYLGDNKRLEEMKEGMEGDLDEDDEEHDEEYDEHVWLSIKNAKLYAKKISDIFIDIDNDNKKTYKTNYEKYYSSLDELDKQYEETVREASRNTIIVADRFPFLYLVEDYGIDYFAAFVGCSAETEASFKTVVFLADKVDTLDLDVVFAIDNSDEKIAETVVSNTKSKNQKILILDSLQSVTKSEMKKGKTYLSTMRDNLLVLKEALK